MVPKPGDRFSHYKVLSKIGSGGMGDVYLAEDTKLDRKVAVKFLNEKYSEDREKLKRFVQEAKATSALNHPHILTVYEIDEFEGTHYIATEYIEGETLRDRLRREDDPLSLNNVLKIGIQAAEALFAAHEAGIVHRDIKPENIMIRRDGYVKVLDFGLAKLLATPATDDTEEIDKEASTQLRVRTKTGMLIGTASYMSPEQARGKDVDERTDIFCFGVLLFEMLTGTAPFKGETVTDLLFAIVEKEPVPISRYAPDTPSELQQMISKSLRKDREERYQTVKSLLADLKTLKAEMEFAEKLQRAESAEARNKKATEKFENETTEAGKPQKTVATKSRPSALFSKRKVAIGGLIGLIIAAAAVGYYFYSNTAAAPLTDRDVILITDFDNKTGEEIFDGTLKQGLTMALQQSPFLSIFSETEVYETLKLMRRDPGSKITRELAREICQRNGLKAYVWGTLSKFGSRYVLGLVAVNSRTGETVASAQAEAESSNEKIVIDLISKAATDLRSNLGESIADIEKFDRPLALTTSSVEALRAFSKGKEVRGGIKLVIPHYKRAIEIDPEFASAYNSLAIGYYNIDEFELARETIQKAYDRRDGVSELERLTITAAYNVIAEHDLLKAIEVYETIKTAFPRSSVRLLAFQYTVIGDIENAILNFELERERSPNISVNYFYLSHLYLVKGQEAKARQMLTILEERRQRENIELRMKLAFLKGDEKEMARLQELSSDFWARSNVAQGMGKWKEVKATALTRADLADQGKEPRSILVSDAALYATAFRKCSDAKTLAAKSLALASNITNLRDLALAFAYCGEHRQALQLLAKLNDKYPKATVVNLMTVPAVEAVIALQSGNAEEAIAILEKTRKYEWGHRMGYWIPHLRAEALIELGRFKEAGAEYERILKVFHEPLSPLRPLAQLGKARVTKSKKEYEKFFEMWKDADEDLPDLIAAKKEYAGLN